MSLSKRSMEEADRLSARIERVEELRQLLKAEGQETWDDNRVFMECLDKMNDSLAETEPPNTRTTGRG